MYFITPISPPSGPSQWLFQKAPAKSKFLATAAAAAKHRDLHPDLFHQNLTHDASGEPEQLLDVE